MSLPSSPSPMSSWKVWKHWGLDEMIVVIVATVAFVWLSHPLSDNSFLTHLTTGRLILDTGSVPHSDPYSFTAVGQEWIVQSWLPSLLYAAVDRWIGIHALIVLIMCILGVTMAIVASMARTGSTGRTILACAIVVLFVQGSFTGRPLVFGLLFLTLTVLIVRQKRSPWWLVPIGVLWVNSHGGWPIAFLWMALFSLGSMLDTSFEELRERAARWTAFFGIFVRQLRSCPVIRPFVALAAGIIGGALISPVGWRLLTFPLIPFGDRSVVFTNIKEWKPAEFSLNAVEFVTLLIGFVLLLLVLVRFRAQWRDLLPVFVFLMLSLMSVRNFGPFAVILAPILGTMLRREAGKSVVELTGWGRIELAGAGMLAFVGILQVATVLSMPAAFDFRSYPVAGAKWLEEQGLSGRSHRVATTDLAAAYRIFHDGTNANVFIDDRYDMYPASVSRDWLILLDAAPGTADVLARYQFDAILWPKSKPLVEHLSNQSNWQRAWEDDVWVIFRKAP